MPLLPGPLALTYQSTSDRKAPPKLLAVLGPAGSGKTSYLGMLADILSRQPGPLEFVARGAFSVQLQQQSIAALARRSFPVDTAIAPGDWNWMHCQVKGRKQRRPLELIVPDMSGAALQADIEHQASPTIRSFLKKCAAAMILVDAERLLRGDQARLSCHEGDQPSERVEQPSQDRLEPPAHRDRVDQG